MAVGRNGSTRKWREVRLFVLQRDGWRCTACGAPATEVDHYVPVRDGGSDIPRNLHAVCRAHNPRGV